MRTIPVKQLTPEYCMKYGNYVNLLDNVANLAKGPISFFPDRVVLGIDGDRVGMSMLELYPRPLIIDQTEFHNHTGEGMLPLDCDMITHVAPAGPGGYPNLDEMEAYLIPKGTLLSIRPGVWHHATYTLPGEHGHCLIILPERTYMNDCVCITLSPEDQIEIKI